MPDFEAVALRLLGFDYLHAAAGMKVLNMTTNLGLLVVAALIVKTGYDAYAG